VPAPFPKKISQILPTFQNVAQTSNYLVRFAIPNGGAYPLTTHLRSKGIDDRFDLSDIGLLCSGASIPGSSFATLDVRGEYQGVIEKMAHTRQFTQIDLEFYVDNQYKSLRFLEHWMEYISGSSGQRPQENAYHFRMRYPEYYKSNETRIIKFEKNHRQYLEYKFIGLFPLALNSTRVQYQNSNVLKATCSFHYDRYISGQTSSLSQKQGRDLNFGTKESNMYNFKPYDNMADVLNPLREGMGIQYGWPNNVAKSITNNSSTTGVNNSNASNSTSSPSNL
tara:strand:+ start:1418 stop:2257 length:840 start_codon:yes stop_codon:yes gene_type:complete